MNQKISVYDLFYKNKEILPTFINKKNIVYLCENQINHKVYIGETGQSLYDRWVSGKSFSHKTAYNNCNTNILYLALKKYGLENFTVEILEDKLDNKIDRWEAEKKWISRFHSYIKDDNPNGYNMTQGGNKKFPKLSKERLSEIGKKSYRTNLKNHNGKFPANSPEAREKARKTQIEKYGCLYINKPEIYKKAIENNKKNHSSILAMNLPENIEKMKISAPKYRMIYNIARHIQYLKDNNFEINSYNYLHKVKDTKRMWQQHIPNVLNKLDELRKINIWTEEMEIVFSHYTYDSTKKGIKKIVIN